MKRALIVDDSKTAQMRLKKMLSLYELSVDTAYSAEEALGYLTYESPSVIFLDHHMEGMDGLEALKIIKANPNTAMIPVIMYTSEEGDVYVGQARALGALDILSKETFKPSSLERVLANLGIQQKSEEETNSEEDATTQTNRDDQALKQIREQIARLFEMHIADVRQQIADNSISIVHKLSEEIEKSVDREPTVGDIPLSVVNAEISAEQRRSSTISGSLLILIFMGLGLLTFELYQTNRQLDKLGQHYSDLVELNRKGQAFLSDMTEQAAPVEYEDETPAVNYALMDALSWALETNLQFDYNTAPLDEKQVVEVSNLIYRLSSAGYRGMVELNIHFGNVCLQQDDTGTWRLADNDLPIDSCTMQEELNQEFSASDYLSVSYLNFEQSAAPLKNGLIEMEVLSSGLSNPRYEYPMITQDMSAGVWNAIALKNNRVSVNFSY